MLTKSISPDTPLDSELTPIIPVPLFPIIIELLLVTIDPFAPNKPIPLSPELSTIPLFIIVPLSVITPNNPVWLVNLICPVGLTSTVTELAVVPEFFCAIAYFNEFAIGLPLFVIIDELGIPTFTFDEKKST